MPKNSRSAAYSALCICLGTTVFTAPDSRAQLLNDQLPVVLTPARLKQNRSEVPASVSVIDREMIAASGIRRIPELFRLIPGTAVGARDGWNHVVSYHGTNYRDSRRMQVLIDGRSIYQAGLATVNWNDIPLAIEDIERIEIVRGPSTASYGANAFLGVINIISRHPEDSDRWAVMARRGSGKTEDYLLSHAGDLADGQFRITAHSRRDDGFDKNADGEDRRDSDNSDMANLRYEKNFGNGTALSFGSGFKQGWNTDDFDDVDVTSPDTQHKNHYLSAKLSWDLNRNHSQHLRLDYSGQKQIKEWQAMIPPAFIGRPDHPSPLVLVSPNENSRQSRQDVEFQDTMIWNKALRTVAGVHYKHNRVSSDTYYNGSRRSDSVQLFGNLEYTVNDAISSNIGASWERDSNEGRKHFSPRVAVHYHFTPNHSIRAVYSEAVRTPDLLETSADWSYRITDIQPYVPGIDSGEYVIKATGNPDLRAERIASSELGYYGNFQQWGLQWDVKVFNDRLKRLVSDSTSLEKFSPENNNTLRQRGIETEIDYRPSSAWLIHASYAYINSDSSNSNEESFTPQNSGSLLVSYQWPTQTRLSIARYYSENTRQSKGRNNTFSRSDVRLAQKVDVGRSELELAYVLRYRHDQNSELLSDNFYDDSTRHLVSVSLRF